MVHIGRFRILLFLLVVFFFGIFAVANVDTHHDGLMLKPALDVARGHMLFRDTFTQYGALTVYIQAAGITLLGENLLAIRATAVLAYATVAVLLWTILVRVVSRRIAGPVFVLWVALAPIYNQYFHSWSSVYALVFQLCGVICLWKYARNEGLRYLFLSGIMASLTFWSRQPVGVFTAAAFGFGILWISMVRGMRTAEISGQVTILLGGIAAGLAPFLLYFHAYGALQDFWLQSVVLGRSFATTVRGTGVRPIMTGLFIPRCLLGSPACWIWGILPGVTVIVTVLYGVRTLAHREFTPPATIRLFLLGLLGMASWMQYYPVPEPSHFFWAATPMVPVLAVAVGTAVSRVRFFHRDRQLLFLWIAVLAFFTVRTSEGMGRVLSARYTADFPETLQGVRLAAEERTFYLQLTEVLGDYFSVLPEKTYINHSLDAMLVLLDPHYVPAHKVYVNWDFVNNAIYPDYQSAVEAYVTARHPLIFTRDPGRFPGYCRIEVVSNQNPPVLLLIWEGDIPAYTTTNAFRRFPVSCDSGRG